MNPVTHAEEPTTAGRWLRNEVADRLDGLDGVAIARSYGFVLGEVVPGAAVQPADLGVIVEVTGKAGNGPELIRRLTDAFVVLGRVQVPNGDALAMASPRDGPVPTPETFTVLVRRSADGGGSVLYAPNLEGNDERPHLGIRRIPGAHACARGRPGPAWREDPVKS